jgi:hypothetical protein
MTSVSGTTWGVTYAPAAFWKYIASDLNGTNLIAAQFLHADIMRSRDTGLTWESSWNASTHQLGKPGVEGPLWVGVAMSIDAKYQYASALGGYLWYSNNGGTNWTESQAPSLYNWGQIACSGDGRIFMATVFGEFDRLL